MRVPPKTILVPTDFSEPANQALDYAIRLAETNGAQVIVLHAYDVPVISFPDGSFVATAEISERILASAHASIDAILQRLKSSGVELRPLLRSGDPRDIIHAVAEDLDVDLIVMGTHGRRGLSRVLLGSVAEYIVRTATRPVLTVRETPPKAKAPEKR